MRNSVLRLIAFPAALFVLLVLLLFQNKAVGHDRNGVDYPEIADFSAAELDAYFDHLHRHNRFMGSVAVLSGGEIVYRRSVGMADIEQQITNTDRTRHHIGSISKTFTAALILQLAEEGKLRLDQPLSDFYDGFPVADDITIKRLLHHRSGLFSFTDDPEYTSWMTEPKSRDELLELMRNYELHFEPGSRTEYSNSNYLLLGFIIEDVTGMSYQDVLEARITGPLGLEDTYYGMQISTDRNESYSYAYSDGWERKPETDMSIPHGAGALLSTPTDVVRFAHALFNGKVLEPASLEKMTHLKDGFGMGLMRYVFHDIAGFGHTGGIDGFQSNLAVFPDEDLYIAFAANAIAWTNSGLLIVMLDAWHGKPVELPDLETVTLSEEHLQAFAGTYTSEQIALEISIWEEDGNLMVKATGQGSITLEATSETRFRFDPAGLVITFHADEEGVFRSFTLFQAGMEFLFERK